MNFDDFYRLIGFSLFIAVAVRTKQAFTLTFMSLANFALYAFTKPMIVADYFQSYNNIQYCILSALFVYSMGALLGSQVDINRNLVINPPNITVQISNVYLPSFVGVILVTLHLALLGHTPFEAINDPISARWALGNGGNILFQAFWTNYLIITAIYIFFSPKRLFHRVLGVVICLVWFPLLSIRAPLIDFVLTVIVIRSFIIGKRGFSLLGGVSFAILALLLISTLGVVRLSAQTGRSLEEIIGSAPSVLNVSSLLLDLILQRLDYLDVLRAAEARLHELVLPPLPFIYNLMPRGLFLEKLFSSDTQVTELAGAGFDEENITRIVGIVAEMMSSDSIFIFGLIYLFTLGIIYKLIDRCRRISRGGLFLYARLLPAAGGLPLLGGWNTIYLSSFVLNLIMSVLIIHFYEKSFPLRSTDR